MPKCSCCGKLGSNKENSSFHRFPREEGLRKKWVEIIGREGWMPTDSSVLCSDHFTEDSFIVYFKRKRIIPGTLPIRYPNEPQRDKLVDRLHVTNFEIPDNSQDYLICKQKNESNRKVDLRSRKNSSQKSRKIAKHETPLNESQDPRSFFVIDENTPEPSIILEYGDFPSIEEKLDNEIGFAYQKLEAVESPKSKKRKPLIIESAHEKILHDHHYDSSLEIEREKFKNCRKKLELVQRENKTLRQLVGRLTKRVASLKDEVKELEAKELLLDGEHSSHKCVSTELKAIKNGRQKFQNLC